MAKAKKGKVVARSKEIQGWDEDGSKYSAGGKKASNAQKAGKKPLTKAQKATIKGSERYRRAGNLTRSGKPTPKLSTSEKGKKK